LNKIKKQFKPDITISTLDGCSAINVLSGGSDKKIGVFHAPSIQLKQQGYFVYLLNLLQYIFIFPFLNKLFCVSQETRNSIVNSLNWINKKKIEVVYNIHDAKNIVSLGNEIIEDEGELFENPVLLYCGRLDRNKSPERLLEAYIQSEAVNSYHLVYMGRDADSMWTEMSETAVKHGVENYVHFIGAKSNPYKFMKNSVALISTSYSEGLPGVIIESLLLHIPVITTNSSEGVWEILSSHNEYNKKLDDLFITNEGIITSNLAFIDKKMNELDIVNIAKAINYFKKNRIKIEKFKFKENVLGENVVAKYLTD
jgi:glycosyltransferase involved in cell wall biosynthesis